MEAHLKELVNHYPSIHSLLIADKTQVISNYSLNKTQLLDIRSMTKTVISTLIGILVTQGKLNHEQPLNHFFNTASENIMVEDLLTMRSGLNLPDSELLRLAKISTNWTKDILELPVVNNGVFLYQGADYHLLSAIIGLIANQPTKEFAQEALFKPLGIEQYYWGEDPSGVSLGSTGLNLSPESLTKLGQLYLNNGVWEGTTILSRQWIIQAATPIVETDLAYGKFGYGWWVENLDGHQVYKALGTGGQQLLISPSLGVVITILSDCKNHNHEKTEKLTKEIFDIIQLKD